MSTVTEPRTVHKLVILNMHTGVTFEVERLPRQPDDYRKSFRLTQLYTGAAVNPVCHAHELPSGLQDCDCRDWIDRRTCPHVEMLRSVASFEEPVLFAPAESRPYNPFDDELVEIEWQSEAP
jgi:hypothetical protein